MSNTIQYFVECAVFKTLSKCWGTTWYGRHAQCLLRPNYYKLELSEEGCDIILGKGNQEILAFKVQKRKKNVHRIKFNKEKSRGII